LGASAADVSGLVIWQGIKPALAGIGLGVIGALLASQVLKSLLFGVSATDPATFVLVPALLFGVAVLACYVPARRASRIDPTVALRAE
jgi:putative ABC transport system permease protein